MRVLVIIMFLVTAASTSILEEKMFIIEKPGGEKDSKLLVVTWSVEDQEEEKAVGCEMFSNPELIEEVVKASTYELVKTPTEQEMQDITDECTEISRRRRRSSSFTRRALAWKRDRTERSENKTNEGNATGQADKILYVLPIIFPGTKWCGSGDGARKFDDLGYHRDTDMCCRAHDLCNDTIPAGETRHNLTNKSSFTKLNCQCDDEFYKCLDDINGVTSNTVGNMYFNLLKRECYALDYPLTNKCKKYRTFLKLKCVEYERDTKAEKVYQWFPAKTYKKIPIPGPITVTLPF